MAKITKEQRKEIQRVIASNGADSEKIQQVLKVYGMEIYPEGLRIMQKWEAYETSLKEEG